MKLNKSILIRIANWMMNIILALSLLSLLWFVAQLFIYASFTIPTDSMAPTLKPGDRILVDKTYMGARLFNFFDALKGNKIDIMRTPGRKHLQHGDIAVFNFPYCGAWNSISMDIRKYYVKRCVGIPGDTVQIANCSFFVNGLPSQSFQSTRQLRQFLEENHDKPEIIAKQVYVPAFPNDSAVPWTVRDFGPLLVPAKGNVIKLTNKNAIIYRNYIEWESGKQLKVEQNKVTLDNQPIVNYTFKENYYFLAGEYVFNSQDSRYFGLVPEPFIVGKASIIWYSSDTHTGKTRKERLFKLL